MESIITTQPHNIASNTSLPTYAKVHYQLNPDELISQTVKRAQGSIAANGALVVNTGKFTGRSPKDRFFVLDEITRNTVDWNSFNIPIDEHFFLQLKHKMQNYLGSQPELWVRDCYACANPDYCLSIRITTEKPWSSLFACNMFIKPGENELQHFEADWQVFQAEGFEADPATDGTRSTNFTIVSFSHKTILIGGSGYTGEIKKGNILYAKFPVAV